MQSSVIEKTRGIVLRVSPFSRTSYVATWLTEDFGKLSTVAKGAQRPKSLSLGQCDMFYTCEVLFYSRERGDSHIMKECTAIDTRDRLRSDWKAAACASYFCDLAQRTCPSHARTDDFYRLLQHTLDILNTEGGSNTLILWFDLQAARVLGLSPRFSHCMSCDGTLEAGEDVRFWFAHGGILCPDCSTRDHSTAERGHPGAQIRVRPDVLAALQAWQDATSASSLAEHGSARELLEAGALLEGFLEYHTHTRLESRRIASELVAT